MNPTVILSPLIQATILADSISTEGVRLTTMELVYPRFIHSELMTHRVFSRNASSSRAIPTKRAIQMIRDHPAVPASWRMNQPGMQGYEVAPEETALAAQAIWLAAMEDAIRHAEAMDALGIHKQVVNRITEPFSHIKVVVTSVYWDNWFGLRNHEAADPTIKALAAEMLRAFEASTPKLLCQGQWHLPYITEEELNAKFHGHSAAPAYDILKRISAARCARVSYNNHDGSKTDLNADLKLHDRLVAAVPPHMSPAEHQATPDTKSERYSAEGDLVGYSWDHTHLHGNLVGWVQYRRTLSGGIADR